jgi:uncharacterized iron-regulated protein
MLSRRHLLASLLVPAVTGCAHRADRSERIIDLASGRDIDRAELLARARAASFVLLGEQHDNPHHHQRRGAFIADLGPGTVVVAEHLTAGARVAAGTDTGSRLLAAGFEARAWGWPLHEALFAPVLNAGLPLLGGNAAADLVRKVAREGPSAWPAEWQARLAAAPLDPAAQAALDRNLVDGHCGHLSASRVPQMRAAQRLRDASMAQALAGCGGRPAVLVAGNGHVRLDHGAAQLLRHWQPAAALLAVGFGEGSAAEPDAPYTHLWLTAGVAREDPCKGMRPMSRG